jgi:DNA-binding transcriptional MerR regulator
MGKNSRQYEGALSEEQDLSQEAPLSHAQTYRIGAVSRLTGVPADTLRVWERRYEVVTPARTVSGTRLYDPEDVGRLSLIKQLVDRGDAISRVARLTMDQLRERVRGAALPLSEGLAQRTCRVVLLGRTLPDRFANDEDWPDGVELVGSFRDREHFAAEAGSLSPDVVVMEYPTVHADQVREILDLLVQSGAATAVLVYNFAARDTIERLDPGRILPQRAPLAPAELRRCCLMTHATAVEAAQPPDDASDIDLRQPIPARRFDDASLVRVIGLSSTVRCECPHHLADLIGNLSAFERYSSECEVRNAEDAALHAYLHAAAARARSIMETALARVLEAEGVVLEGKPDQPSA